MPPRVKAGDIAFDAKGQRIVKDGYLKNSVGNRFAKGTKPGPGAPKGVKRLKQLKVTEVRKLVAAIKDDPEAAVERIMGALLHHAEKGNTFAAEIFLRYYQPRPKRPIAIQLPKLLALKDVAAASALVVEGMNGGLISEADADLYQRILAKHREHLEPIELVNELHALKLRMSDEIEEPTDDIRDR